jgi:protein-tyrosine phosphatase
MADDVLEEMHAIAKEKFDPAKAELFLNELHPGTHQSVPDPWYGPEPGYHEVFKLIEKTCNQIISKYKHQ